MTRTEAKLRIEKLCAFIERNRYLYHVLDRPRVSDAVDDSLKHELAVLERRYPEFTKKDSPTQQVGGEPRPKFRHVRFPRPFLLSLIHI